MRGHELSRRTAKAVIEVCSFLHLTCDMGIRVTKHRRMSGLQMTVSIQASPMIGGLTYDRFVIESSRVMYYYFLVVSDSAPVSTVSLVEYLQI